MEAVTFHNSKAETVHSVHFGRSHGVCRRLMASHRGRGGGFSDGRRWNIDRIIVWHYVYARLYANRVPLTWLGTAGVIVQCNVILFLCIIGRDKMFLHAHVFFTLISESLLGCRLFRLCTFMRFLLVLWFVIHAFFPQCQNLVLQTQHLKKADPFFTMVQTELVHMRPIQMLNVNSSSKVHTSAI